MPDTTTTIVGNLTDDPEVRYTQDGIARAVFRVAVSGRREQEPSFFTVIVWRDQAEHASKSLSRAAGSWSWVGSSSGPGPLRMAAPGPPSRSWPTSWDRAFAGQRQPPPGRRGARTSSQLDQAMRRAGRGQHARVPLRRVRTRER